MNLVPAVLTMAAPGNDFPLQFAGVAQLVEHQLPKLRVAGSNPVARLKAGRQ